MSNPAAGVQHDVAAWDQHGDTLADQARQTAGTQITPGRAYGFFTDTTLCIGCKACEVACKQWNQLPADDIHFSGASYDNTRQLSATTWRHVTFIEQFDRERFAGLEAPEVRPGALPEGEQWAQPGQRWIFLSDVCKHCVDAPCLEACPTGSIVRTEFDTVYVQQDVCNGCGYCVPACPFGVVQVDRERDGKAHKCTLCYDRLKDGMEPACAKACPTDSIQFGPVDELLERARERAEQLRERGIPGYLYGSGGPLEEECDTSAISGLNCFFLLIDRPEVYNLPPAPKRPSSSIGGGLLALTAAALALTASTFLAFRDGNR
ncbi:MAG TPA: 4Fe-4S dicluster domain-containing protein [Gemmatimonadales bacterium]|jgi:formate dehydrogenase iron-sulfur subunit|nr:4Fe-4S dicluster domain-containing protein [Gemmatimonadales bacterium]